MLDWHSCQICYPLQIKLILLLEREIERELTTSSVGNKGDYPRGFNDARESH